MVLHLRKIISVFTALIVMMSASPAFGTEAGQECESFQQQVEESEIAGDVQQTDVTSQEEEKSTKEKNGKQ